MNVLELLEYLGLVLIKILIIYHAFQIYQERGFEALKSVKAIIVVLLIVYFQLVSFSIIFFPPEHQDFSFFGAGIFDVCSLGVIWLCRRDLSSDYIQIFINYYVVMTLLTTIFLILLGSENAMLKYSGIDRNTNYYSVLNFLLIFSASSILFGIPYAVTRTYILNKNKTYEWLNKLATFFSIFIGVVGGVFFLFIGVLGILGQLFEVNILITLAKIIILIPILLMLKPSISDAVVMFLQSKAIKYKIYTDLSDEIDGT